MTFSVFKTKDKVEKNNWHGNAFRCASFETREECVSFIQKKYNVSRIQKSDVFEDDRHYYYVVEMVAEKLEENLLGEQMDTNETTQMNEFVMNMQQRRKRGLVMKKYARKIAMARRRKSKRLASMDQIKSRAMKMARVLLRRRFAGPLGAKYNDLSVGQKMMIDKRMQGKSALIARIAKKLLPRIKKADQLRFKNRTANAAAKNS